jgi:hypothetical protein
MKNLNKPYKWILTISLSVLFLLGCVPSLPTVNQPADRPTAQPAPAEQVSSENNDSKQTDQDSQANQETIPVDSTSNDPSNVTDLPELAAIPTEIAIGAQKISLDIFLWRDFQPISPPEGKPMLALVKLVNPESNEAIALEGVAATRIWVFHRDDKSNNASGEIWTTQLTQQLASEYMARQGPKWEPGTQIDVVVEIVDDAENVYFLKAAQQIIQRTD